MIMDAEDVQSDLHALKRLYGLLKMDGGEASNTDSNSLDASARLLLKNLLDTATKSVLKSHSEVVAEASPDQPDEAASDQSERERNSPDRSQAIGERRCRVCRRNTVKQLVSTGDVAQNSNIYDRHPWNRVKQIRWLSSKKLDDERPFDLSIFGDADRMVEMGLESDYLSQEASRAIQQIEGCMSALQTGVGADHMHLLEKPSSTRVPETKSAVQTENGTISSIGPNIGENFVIRNNLLFELSDERNQPHLSSSHPVWPTKDMSKKSVLRTDASGIPEEECRYPTQKVNKVYLQNVNAIVESGNWIMSSNQYVPLIPSNTSYITPRWSTLSSSNMEDEPPFSFMDLKNHQPNITPEKVVKKQSDAQHKVGFQKGRHDKTSVRTALPHQESDTTATDSDSNWSGDQTSGRDSSSVDSSVADQTRGLHYVASSKSSGSRDISLSHESGSQYSSYRSNSEEEDYSSSSREGDREVTSNSSSEEDGSSSLEQPLRSYSRPKYESKQSTSKKSGPSRIEKAYGMSHNKQSGIFKRLKDRLAVIFHHHHHHHHHYHHHHHHNRGDRTNNEESTSHNSSLNKHKGEDISPGRQDSIHKVAVEKMHRSRIHEKRGQDNHFHGLMGGLLRHVRHSKQSKKGKGAADQFAHEHGKKRTLKKNWWQLLQHHGRSKLHEKTHKKFGLAKKKTLLKALPKIK